MLIGQELALSRVATVLILEVEQQAVHLHGQDLIRPEEAEVNRLAMVTGRNLDLAVPGVIADRADRFLDRELAAVAKPGRSPRVRPDDDIEPDRLRHGAERVQLDVRIAAFDPSHRVRRDAGPRCHHFSGLAPPRAG